jgi:hypothetical protein
LRPKSDRSSRPSSTTGCTRDEPGIDATTRYGLQVPGTQPLLESQLKSTNPYNTRNPNIKGLTPTPISNPGLASMQAAAHPAKVDYLYFVRKPDHVHHFFTASAAEFEATRTRTASGDHRAHAARRAARASRLGLAVAADAERRLRRARLDWAYVACDVAPDRRDRGARARRAGFAGANVTTPHKAAAAALADTELDSVNTLVFTEERSSVTRPTRRARRPDRRAACDPGRGEPRSRFARRCPSARVSPRGRLAARDRRADLVVNATSERNAVLVELEPGQMLVELPYPKQRRPSGT